MKIRTPSTSRVRNVYIQGTGNQTEFDLWLKKHDAEVAKATEERIAKLLETNYKGPNGLLWTERDLRSLIALIKGEQK